MEERFDVIVVGGGPSGLASAYCLAKKGFKAVLIERGRYLGSKNVYGGRIYSHAVEKVFPDFRKEAPIERWVRKELLTFMTEDEAVTIEFSSSKHPEAPHDSFIAYLTSFTQWMGKKAEEAGALIVTGIKVDKILMENGKAVGVAAGPDKLYADVIVDAEGINPVLIEELGLKSRFKSEHVAVGVKEAVRLPSKTIEERFNLLEDEGAAQLFVGYPTKGLPGGAFLYTNKDTVTFGVVAHLNPIAKNRVPVHEIIEDFRLHPAVKRLLEGGVVMEYLAHLIPEGGIHMVPKLHANNLLVVGDAAGFGLNNGITVRGVDFAVESGRIAAEAIEKAHGEGNYSEDVLGAYYEQALNDSFVLKELKAFKKAPSFLSNPRIYNLYPQLICELLSALHTVNGTPKKLYPTLRSLMKRKNASIISLIRDLVGGIRSL